MLKLNQVQTAVVFFGGWQNILGGWMALFRSWVVKNVWEVAWQNILEVGKIFSTLFPKIFSSTPSKNFYNLPLIPLKFGTPSPKYFATSPKNMLLCLSIPPKFCQPTQNTFCHPIYKNILPCHPPKKVSCSSP